MKVKFHIGTEDFKDFQQMKDVKVVRPESKMRTVKIECDIDEVEMDCDTVRRIVR